MYRVIPQGEFTLLNVNVITRHNNIGRYILNILLVIIVLVMMWFLGVTSMALIKANNDIDAVGEYESIMLVGTVPGI